MTANGFTSSKYERARKRERVFQRTHFSLDGKMFCGLNRPDIYPPEGLCVNFRVILQRSIQREHNGSLNTASNGKKSATLCRKVSAGRTTSTCLNWRLWVHKFILSPSWTDIARERASSQVFLSLRGSAAFYAPFNTRLLFGPPHICRFVHAYIRLMSKFQYRFIVAPGGAPCKLAVQLTSDTIAAAASNFRPPLSRAFFRSRCSTSRIRFNNTKKYSERRV